MVTVWGVRYRRYRTPHTVGRITATNDPLIGSQGIISGRLKKRNFVDVDGENVAKPKKYLKGLNWNSVFAVFS